MNRKLGSVSIAGAVKRKKLNPRAAITTTRALIPIGALGHLTTLTIGCIRCDRRATFRVADLLVQHGPQKPVAEVLAELSKGCPQQDAPTLGKECDVRSLDLLKLLEP